MAAMHRLLPRSILRMITPRSRIQRHMCSAKDLDKPVKFSSSEAATWKAEYSRSGGPTEDSLWCEPHIVLASVGTFLLYFCVLREENDIDLMIETPLSSKIEGFEEAQLRVVHQYNLEKGLPTEDVAQRLKEIEKEKASKLPSP